MIFMSPPSGMAQDKPATTTYDPADRPDVEILAGEPGPGEPVAPRAVATLLFVDRGTVSRWAESGKLGSVRTRGGQRRYLMADVLAIMSGGYGDHPRQAAPLAAPAGGDRGEVRRPPETREEELAEAVVRIAAAVAAAVEKSSGGGGAGSGCQGVRGGEDVVLSASGVGAACHAHNSSGGACHGQDHVSSPAPHHFRAGGRARAQWGWCGVRLLDFDREGRGVRGHRDQRGVHRIDLTITDPHEVVMTVTDLVIAVAEVTAALTQISLINRARASNVYFRVT